MRTNSLKIPKQLSLPFMKELERKAILSQQEYSELIHALAELIITYARSESLSKELHDEH